MSLHFEFDWSFVPLVRLVCFVLKHGLNYDWLVIHDDRASIKLPWTFYPNVQ